MRKLISIMLAASMVFAMSATAFAVNNNSIDIEAELFRARNGISDIPVEEAPIVSTAYLATEEGENVPLTTYTTVRVLDAATPFSLNSNPTYAVTTYATTEELFDGVLDDFNGEVWAYATLYYQKQPLGSDHPYIFVSTDGGWASGGWTLENRKVEYGFGAVGIIERPSSDTFNYSVNKGGKHPKLQTTANIVQVGTITLNVAV